MSVTWHPSCRTYIGASPQSPASHTPTFFAAVLRFLDEWQVWASIVRGLFVYTLNLSYPHRSSSSKCFNTLEYCVSIWNCTSTHNIEISTEKMLDSNYGITVSKKLLDGKCTMLYVPMHDALHSNASRLLKLHCLSCPPTHAQHHQPHPCQVVAIWKTCFSSLHSVLALNIMQCINPLAPEFFFKF